MGAYKYEQGGKQGNAAASTSWQLNRFSYIVKSYTENAICLCGNNAAQLTYKVLLMTREKWYRSA